VGRFANSGTFKGGELATVPGTGNSGLGMATWLMGLAANGPGAPLTPSAGLASFWNRFGLESIPLAGLGLLGNKGFGKGMGLVGLVKGPRPGLTPSAGLPRFWNRLGLASMPFAGVGRFARGKSVSLSRPVCGTCSFLAVATPRRGVTPGFRSRKIFCNKKKGVVS